ncbi:MAG: M15 family metallopeptidase [Treponema sp.]|nr:M15 family metallopeptidase [Treponema sp.]
MIEIKAVFVYPLTIKSGIFPSSPGIRRSFTAALLFLAAGLLFPLGKAENNVSGHHDGPAESEIGGFYELAEASGPGNADPSVPNAAPEQGQGSRAERVMKALAAAYPERIGEAELRDGDWAVPVLGERFYYAQGRLLPEALKDKIEEYDPQPFYNYAPDLPPWREPEPAETERFRNSAQRRQENPPKRSQHFYDALWQAHTREEAYERVKTIRFLSRTVLAHYAILEDLALVEARILREAQTDPQLREWIRNIETLSGWNWRSIADTQSRSFHAYGAAIDILPAARRGLETYWLWTSRNNPQWWAVPYSKRLHPPDKVIKAFEAYGFIWGGKWLFYDTMHFEYRPEIFLLNDLPVNRY